MQRLAVIRESRCLRLETCQVLRPLPDHRRSDTRYAGLLNSEELFFSSIMYLPSGVRLSPATCFAPSEPRPRATRYVFSTVLPDMRDKVCADFEMTTESTVASDCAEMAVLWTTQCREEEDSSAATGDVHSLVEV